ncbi:letm1 and EF-hand domain-containing protein 1, mitochondrial [Coemansia sp. RSA 1365]|nr:letm1 and EF-hand domain-containing protein 1, mitochondrial [Coemansia sp. RSA 1365]
MPSVVVYGGRGALGSACVGLFKRQAWKVISIDYNINPEADDNVIVSDSRQGLAEHGARITQDIGDLLGGDKTDAVICVAGGWQGGNAASKNFLKNADLSIKQSVDTSLIAANIAARHLRQNGLLALTGAIPALEGGTPGMVGYGMAKAAVHHLVTSLAMPGSGIDGGRVVGILPQTLDTPANRSAMPSADFSLWTPLPEVANVLHQWASDQTSCESGRLYKVITKDSVTSII